MKKSTLPRKKRTGRKHDIKRRFRKGGLAKSENAMDMLYECYWNVINRRTDDWRMADKCTRALMGECSSLRH